MATFIIGVSLGTTQTTTALCVLEQRGRDTGEAETYGLPGPANWNDQPMRPAPTRAVYEHSYAVRHLERLTAGTPYPEQVSLTQALVSRLKEQQGRVTLVLDQTGVGRPVTDLFRSAKLEPKAATVTGGDTVSREGNETRVPKRDLVSSAQVLLQAKRLTIASSLPLVQVLISELLAFKTTITLQRENSSAPPEPWRERSHDDLVLAVALAAWYGETHKPLQTSGFTIPTGYQDSPWNV